MATLGAVYDAEPAPRTVDDIIADPDRQDADHGAVPERRQGPKARSKWLCGSVTDTAAQVVCAVFDQAEHRDPGHRRPWVVLVDGARHQIDLIKAEARQRGVDVHIIVDLIHVLEYLWRARGACTTAAMPPPRAGSPVTPASCWAAACSRPPPHSRKPPSPPECMAPSARASTRP
ncbi:hypothetical protein ACFU8W_45550 [Streptomyces sp. NPDC057565]|uniref:hypothetical protein n=1 Tax=Streptomyces sp. NPDC057565 TaxID=3346169 RepID=UPI0036B6A2D2